MFGITDYLQLISCLFVDVSIEQVAALSSQNTLPEPSLDLDTLQPSTFRPGTNFRQNTIAADDPWKIGGGMVTGPSNMSGFDSARTNGVPSTLAGSGLPKEWWKRQDSVTVTILGQQGFILNRYMVYQVSSDVRSFLHVCEISVF